MRSLDWTKPSFWTRAYLLRERGERVAWLRWEGAFSSRAEAETPEGRWTLGRSGFFNSIVTVGQAGSTIEVARLERSWRGCGTLQGPGGRRYAWSKLSLWRPEWVFTDDAGRVVVRFRPSLLKQCASVEVEPAGASSPDLTLLLVVGWYVILQSASEGGAAAAAAS